MYKLNPEIQKIVNKISQNIVKENVKNGIDYKNNKDLFEKYGFVDHDVFSKSLTPFQNLDIFKKVIKKNKK